MSVVELYILPCCSKSCKVFQTLTFSTVDNLTVMCSLCMCAVMATGAQ